MRTTQYAFLLGRKPLLSLAELASLYPHAQAEVIERRFIILDFEEKMDSEWVLGRLGGTVKIMQLNDEDPLTYLARISNATDGKFLFAINIYGGNERVLRQTLREAKTKLHTQNIASRFLNRHFRNASFVSIAENNLVAKKSDINVLMQGEIQRTAITVAIQDFKAYGNRDFEKPFRDAKNGMLPPKLAQIMINLANREYIVDPFCGSGTVLMEALLMGKEAAGSDIDKGMVAGSRENIAWLLRNEKIVANPSVQVRDATALQAEDLPDDSYGIVTEPYLGPPQRRMLYGNPLSKLMEELADLYLRFFENLRNFIPQGTPIVIALPCFRQHRGYAYLPHAFIEKVEALAYSRPALIPEKWMKQIADDLSQFGRTPRGLLYDRPKQLVGREIVKFVYSPRGE